MRIWLRRLLIAAFVLLWLMIILLPTVAFTLARNGQIQIGRSDGRHWRVFLVQEADAEGIGLERGRPVASPGDAPAGVSCLRVTVAYWMWTGEGQPVAYCQCADETTGDVVDITPPACLTPDA